MEENLLWKIGRRQTKFSMMENAVLIGIMITSVLGIMMAFGSL